MSAELPYPGLRPFDADEAHLFFGRARQVAEILRRLGQSRFVAVVGPSGCGKSSLVRAGLIASLEAGLMSIAGSRWQIAIMRPGGQPMLRLARALADSTSLAPPEGDHDSAVGFLSASLRRGPLGLAEALALRPLPDRTNLLVLVDQFEEIFRFRQEGGVNEAAAFVSLLLESARVPGLPIYIVITMRSDFFGDCAVFQGLPEQINQSQFLTPRLTREQREEAIVGPARVFGGDVAPDLVNRLLNEMGDEPDQLPIMQHLLMRMWTWRGAADAELRTLTIADYEAVGGYDRALSNHADEVYTALGGARQRIAELMFRRLSERSSRSRDIRRPTRASEIAALCNVPLAEVIAVVDAFRAPEASFLVPRWPDLIGAENRLDITHESLIRQWRRLRSWSRDERDSARTFQRLSDTADRWRDGKAALWGTPELELALDWERREAPTAVWAQRYGGDFDNAIAFLRASERKHQADLARTQRHYRLARLANYAMVVALILVIGAAFALYQGYVGEAVAYYNTFVKQSAGPKGIGPLSKSQVAQRLVSFKFMRSSGFLGPVTEITAVDRDGNCTSQHEVGTHIESGSLRGTGDRECRWKFIYDRNGNVVSELAYDAANRLVYGFAYVPGKADRALVAQAYYVGPNGTLASFPSSRAEIVTISYNNEGYEETITYQDSKGEPQRGRDRAFGQRVTYDQRGIANRLVSIDADGQPIEDEVGNAGLAIQSDANGNPLVAEAFDRNGRPVAVTEGWHRATQKFDSAGNLEESRFFGLDNSPAYDQRGVHSWLYRYARGRLVGWTTYGADDRPVRDRDWGVERVDIGYDDDGGVASYTFRLADGTPTTDANLVHLIKVVTKQGHEIERRLFDVNGKPTRGSDGSHGFRTTYDEFGRAAGYLYLGVNGEPVNTRDGYARQVDDLDARGHTVRTAYFAADGKPTRHVTGYHILTSTYDVEGNRVEQAVFDFENRPTHTAAGWHRVRWSGFDMHRKAAETAYFGVENEPVMIDEGYQRQQTTYDARGNPIERSYFGLDGTKAVHRDGYHKVVFTYDRRDQVISEAYFDTNGRAVAINGAHRVAMARNARGDVLERTMFGVDNEPVVGPFRETTTVDGHGRAVESRFFDGDGRPVAGAEGYTVERHEYDARGWLLADAQLSEDKGSRFVFTTDGAGHVIGLALFNPDGSAKSGPNGAHSGKWIINEDGNAAEETWWGLDDAPAVNADGAHHIVYEHNAAGAVVRESSFGLDGAPIREIRSDDLGREVATTYFVHDRWARNEKTYDAWGRVIAEALFNTDGPVQDPDTEVHREETTYTPRGTPRRRIAYDVAGTEKHVVDFDDAGRPARKTIAPFVLGYRYDQVDGMVVTEISRNDGKAIDGTEEATAVYRREVVAPKPWGLAKYTIPREDGTLRERFFGATGLLANQGAFDVQYVGIDYERDPDTDALVKRYVDATGATVLVEREVPDPATGKPSSTYARPDGTPLHAAVVVLRVFPDSPAQRLGLRPGDALLRYAGREVSAVQQFAEFVSDTSGGERELVIQREGKIVVLTVPPGRLGIEIEVSFRPEPEQ